MPTYRDQLVHQLQCQGPLSEQGARELTDAAIAEAGGEAYPGELAMFRTLFRTARIAARDEDFAAIQQALIHHAGDDAAARAEAKEKSSPAGAGATPVLTVYRASHDSIVMGLYTTRQAAYEHCEAHELRDDAVSPMTWNVDEDGVAELLRIRVPRSPGAESTTGYEVTPLEIASEYDAEADE